MVPAKRSLRDGIRRISTNSADEKGFTLLEVMISLAILSGVIVVVIGSLNYHISVLAYDTDLVTATIFGRQKVEEQALFGLPKVRTGTGEKELRRFRWRVERTGTDVKGLVRVETEVKWDEDRGVSFVTFAAK